MKLSKQLIPALVMTIPMMGCQQANEVQMSVPASAEVGVQQEPVDLVWPWLDSANSRWFYFNSATRPFGMVNLSPDTEINGAWGSGYRYNTEEIKGFNHVHAWQLAGLSVFPVSQNSNISSIEKDYFSPFSHDNEVVKAGYHKVTLDRYGIDAELTATKRVGFHRYTFPTSSSTPRQILLDMDGQFGPSALSKGHFTQLSETAFSGSVINAPTIRRPRPTPVFFYIETDSPMAVSETDTAVLLTSTAKHNEIKMKVAISYVDEAGAKNNMASELAGWDFDGTVADAREEWNEWLSRVQVTGSDEKTRQRFYTDLFHALQGRRTISDADGRYSDQTAQTRRIGQIPLDENGEPAFSHHNSDSFWGAQWTIQTLWPLAYPEVVSDFTNSMLMMAKDGGMVPRGPSGGNYTYVMTGASSTPFIVSAYMKGIRDFDAGSAFEALKKNHLPGGIMARAGYEHDTAVGGGLSHYIEAGYVPYPLPEKSKAYHQDGAGQTLEYAYQDYTLSQFAQALGKSADATEFAQRAMNYKNLYDVQSGFMRPKNVDGAWKTPFDPYQYQHGFVESNAAQMTWYVPHDIAGLAELMGGKAMAAEKLNAAFEEAARLGFTSGTAHDKETHEEYRRIPINYGNQPSMQTAFIFNALDEPAKTQYWTREVINNVYAKLSPEFGFNGDEDQGLMGSLSVLMKIGLFQIDGGASINPVYQIGSPIFDRIDIALSDDYYSGEHFVIETVNNSDENRYIQKAWLNGKPLDRFYLTHEEITSGGTLRLEMGPQPASH
ncbi:GH92 family glycosyl hydrolase [Aestuariibacter sp. A3R04]|uniref:GH92 family glycosyl hydrolase n=1 Tax=Aestuariibacter sp. A3R04 TaxID=2841571 RepID=UPI001C09BDC7|nr:GH92 family glycosyl hydrolase [Aestuariibacter sp. A3R04]MBU3023796.1 GH92 family glycosyl hydrolase [Aestuariibacter sp. A3R04]